MVRRRAAALPGVALAVHLDRPDAGPSDDGPRITTLARLVDHLP